MITSWDIYWITRLDSINVVCFWVWIIIVVLTCLTPIWIDVFEEENVFRLGRRLIAIGIMAIVVNIFCPSTKEASAIYLIPKIVNNEQMQKVPDHALKLLNAKMEEWLNDTIKKEKGK